MATEDDHPEDGGEANGESTEGAAKKGLSLKKILIILVPLLLLGGGAAAYFTGMLDSLLGTTTAKEGEEHAEQKGHEKKEGEHSGGAKGEGEHGETAATSSFIEIPTMIVNLNSPDGEPRYLRLTVQLELEDPGDAEAVQAVIPRVVDQFQTYLRELRVRDLRGSAGMYRLQMELLWRVNQAAHPSKIKDVLFQEILIQ